MADFNYKKGPHPSQLVGQYTFSDGDPSAWVSSRKILQLKEDGTGSWQERDVFDRDWEESVRCNGVWCCSKNLQVVYFTSIECSNAGVMGESVPISSHSSVSKKIQFLVQTDGSLCQSCADNGTQIQSYHCPSGRVCPSVLKKLSS